MFIQPNGRRRTTKNRGKATGLILIGFGALVFLTVIQRYTQHVMPSVRMAQAASAYYGFQGSHANLAPVSDLDESKIRSVISSQVSALKRKDFGKAMKFAAIDFPDVTPGMYESFLEARYPQNAAPRSVSFQDTAMSFEQSFALQRVQLTGQDGTTVQELYLMIATDSGWRIRRFRMVGHDGMDDNGFDPWRDAR